MDAVVWSWLAKELGKKDLEEVKAAASCKGLVELAQLAESLGPKSRLYLHLKDRKFEACDPKAVPAQPIRKKIGLLDVSIKIPLVHVKAMKKRSGTPTSGAQARFHKLDVLKRPAAATKIANIRYRLDFAFFPPSLNARIARNNGFGKNGLAPLVTLQALKGVCVCVCVCVCNLDPKAMNSRSPN